MLQGLLDRRVTGELRLKVDAQVILTKNQPTLGLVNGSRGVVQGFRDGRPVVRFDTGQSVHVGKERFTVGSSSASLLRIQVPLKLGWALTVHKAQGMTLSRAELQVDDAFEAGQAYVALSRLTSLGGLWMRGGGLSRSNTSAHSDVLRYYEATTSVAEVCRHAEPQKTISGATLSVRNASAEALATSNPRSKAPRDVAPRGQDALKDSTLEAKDALKDSVLGARSQPRSSLDPSPDLKRKRFSRLAKGAKSVDSAPLESVVKGLMPQAATSGVVGGLDVTLSSAADACVGWVDPPKTWGGGVIELD